MEKTGAVPGIDDPLEGIMRFTIDDFYSEELRYASKEFFSFFLRYVNPTFEVVDPKTGRIRGAHVTLSGSHSLSLPNDLMICCSRSLNSKVAKKLIEDSKNFDKPYTHAIPINNEKQFSSCISEALAKKLGPPRAAPTFGPVEYRTKLLKLRDNPRFIFTALSKEPDFRDQDEYRFVFHHEMPKDEKNVLISASFPPEVIGEPIELAKFL
ncbi:MAG: hypothetical protein ACFBWO_00295 [Paracoccaceae bacterium]